MSSTSPDFVVELSSADAHQEEANFRWVLSVDGSSDQQGSGAGVILEGPNRLLIEQALRFAFKASDNQAEYDPDRWHSISKGYGCAKFVGEE